MLITDLEKSQLISSMKLIGVKVPKKLEEFKKFGTCVIAANKAVKKKLDVITTPFENNGTLKISEFDDNMWRLVDVGIIDTMTPLKRAKEVQI